MSENLEKQNEEEVPLIMYKKESPQSSAYSEYLLSQLRPKAEQNSTEESYNQLTVKEEAAQIEPYRWNINDEPNISSRSVSVKQKKKRGHLGLRIFAVIMSVMFLLSATATGYMIIDKVFNTGENNNASSGAAVLSNKAAVEETAIVSSAPTNSAMLTAEDAIAKADPSVVCIETEAELVVRIPGMRNTQPYLQSGVGTGFIVTDDGYIATNYHVIEDADVIYVTLFTGERYEAEVIGGDVTADLAIIKINAKNLPEVELGDSDALIKGNTVIAIGTPAGIEFGWTATQGIISAASREIIPNTNFDLSMTVIQTDASINPGNSGGPLINLKGQVIGINSMKLASSSYEGMGFAIPINIAIPIFNDIIANPGIKNSTGSVDFGSADTSTVSFGIQGNDVYDDYTGEPYGWKIAVVNEDGPCWNSGIQTSDIIIALDGEMVTGYSDLVALKLNYKPGDKAVVTILRNGDEYDFTITFAAR